MFGLDELGAVLARAARNGCIASRQRMIVCNLRLVVNVARAYVKRGLPLLDLVEEGKAYMQMKGNEVFKVAVKTLGGVATEALEANGISKEELDWLVPHQANIRIINKLIQQLEIDSEKVYINVPKYGNTSAATIPLALDEANHEGRLQSGDYVMLCAFGGGFTWGATLIKWQ